MGLFFTSPQALYSLHLGSHPISQTEFLNDAVKILNSGAECLSVDTQRLRGLAQVGLIVCFEGAFKGMLCRTRSFCYAHLGPIYMLELIQPITMQVG